MEKLKVDGFEITLKWNKDFEKKFGSKQNLVDLYNNNYVVRDNLRNKTLFGEVINIGDFLDFKKIKNYSIFTINSKNIGIKIFSIKMSKDKQDVLVKILPVEPNKGIILEHFLENGTLYLHPRVPNLGTLNDKILIPITFDLILFEEPSNKYSQEIKKVKISI